jgi:hypothetical protein
MASLLQTKGKRVISLAGDAGAAGEHVRRAPVHGAPCSARFA